MHYRAIILLGWVVVASTYTKSWMVDDARGSRSSSFGCPYGHKWICDDMADAFNQAHQERESKRKVYRVDDIELKDIQTTLPPP